VFLAKNKLKELHSVALNDEVVCFLSVLRIALFCIDEFDRSHISSGVF